MEPNGYLMAGRLALWLGLAGAAASLLVSARLSFAPAGAGGLEEDPRRRQRLQLARSLYLFAAALVVFAWGYFVWQLLAQNFQSVYVYQHSSQEMPFKNIFAASWAGQAGSF